MTPKQREILRDLQVKISRLESYAGRLRRQLRKLPEYFDSAVAPDKGEFTADEIRDLICFNQRLSDLELYLCELGEKECAPLDTRISDSNDPLNDYEIDVTLYFTLSEDDPEFTENNDKFLTQRHISLKHLSRLVDLGDGQDYSETSRYYPGDLNEVPHCWLFHNLYASKYALEQPPLTLQDCLRVGSILVDVAVHHQATLDIKTGKWLPPTDSVLLKLGG